MLPTNIKISEHIDKKKTIVETLEGLGHIIRFQMSSPGDYVRGDNVRTPLKISLKFPVSNGLICGMFPASLPVVELLVLRMAVVEQSNCRIIECPIAHCRVVE